MPIIIDVLKVLGLVWMSLQFLDLFKSLPNKIIQGVVMLLDCPKCLSFWYSLIFFGFFESVLIAFIVYQVNKIPFVNKNIFR